MSYLVLPGGIPAFSKAVISFWFRVPQASLAAAKAQYDAVEDQALLDINLKGVVPLVTFGPNETYQTYLSDDGGTTWFKGDACKTSPCVIGVVYNPTFNFDNVEAEKYVLVIRLQYDTGAPPPPTSGSHDLQSICPDFFQVGFFMDGSLFPAYEEYRFKVISVAPDHWHHVLISFDMSSGASTSPGVITPASFTTVCKFWWAYDDVNYKGEYLWPFCPANFGSSDEENGIASNWCMTGARTFAAGPIPTAGKPIGIPASTADVSHVYNVELAELQIFTGVTLDTGNVANRRAFIDVNGKPVKPTAAATWLGQKPDILLHGTSNWKIGKNTGSRGVDSSGNVIPAGQFQPTGLIKPYKPDPSLHGPQFPKPTAGPVQLTRSAHAGL